MLAGFFFFRDSPLCRRKLYSILRSLAGSHSSNEILISQTNRFIANNWLTLAAETLKLFFHPPFALIRRASIETQINRLMKIKSANGGRNKEDEWIMERRKKLRSSEGLL